MYIQFTTSRLYHEAFPTARCVYGTAEFTALVAPRAEAVIHAVGSDDGEHPRLGLILGLREGAWMAPFSAPFAELAYRKPQALEHIYDFFTELHHQLGEAPLRVTLPPAVYDPAMIPKAAGTLANLPGARAAWDYNYHYPLSRAADFPRWLEAAFRNHYNFASRQGFTLEDTPIARAYAVIAANRAHRGYPLAMSQEQVERTAEVVPVLALTLTSAAGDAASAIVYHTSPAVAQVIYWGDSPEHTHLRPMNILPLLVARRVKEVWPQAETLDIGPASTLGVPNAGLCRYKEAFGCLPQLKLTVTLQ